MFIDESLLFCISSLLFIIGYLLYAIIKIQNEDEKPFGNLDKSEFIKLTTHLNNFLCNDSNHNKIFNICKSNTNILRLST